MQKQKRKKSFSRLERCDVCTSWLDSTRGSTPSITARGEILIMTQREKPLKSSQSLSCGFSLSSSQREAKAKQPEGKMEDETSEMLQQNVLSGHIKVKNSSPHARLLSRLRALSLFPPPRCVHSYQFPFHFVHPHTSAVVGEEV